jgi:hypothetical protein
MNREARWTMCLAAVTATLISGAVFAADPVATPTIPPASQPESQQQLQDEVHALRSEVNDLKQKQAVAATPVPARTSDTTGLELGGKPATGPVEGFMSGFTLDRFTLQSPDGNYVLRPWFHLQVRDVTSVRQNFKVGGADDTENGFEIRRLRFGFDGNVITPNLTYFFNWATVRANGTATVTNHGTTVGTVSNNQGGSPLLEEGWFKYYEPVCSFYIKAGQIKDPVYHESIVSSRYQQATERSLTADIFFNGDTFAEAATIGYDPKSFFRAEGGIDHGLRSANTNFLDFPNTNAFNYGLVGRAEYKVMGRWQDYQMGAWGVKEPLLVFGIGSEYSERGHAGQTVADVDVMYADQNGISLYGSFTDRYTNHNFGIATQSATGASIAAPPAAVLNTATNEYSLVGEAGYLMFGHLEPFGRFEYMHLAGTPTGSHTYIPAVTGGANYYFAGHRAKLTVQGTYLPNGIPIDDTANDVLANPGKHGEFVGVAQFQLLL